MKLPKHVGRLARMVAPYKGRLGIALLAMAVTAATEPLLVTMMKLLLDRGFVPERTFPLWMVPAVLVGIFVLRGMSTYLTNYMMTWVTARLLNELRGAVFSRMLELPLAYYASNPVGKVINAMMFEAQQIVDMLKEAGTSVVRDTLTVAGLVGFLLYLNWRLTLVTLVLLPLIALIIRATGRRLRRLSKSYLGINAELTQVVEETTRAQQVIKIFGGQTYERNRFAERAERLRGYAMRMVKTQALTSPLTQVIAACGLSVVIMVALVQAGQNQTSVGGFVSFITAMLMLLTPLKRLAEVNGPLQRGMAAADSIFELIDAEPERTTGRTLPGRARGRIEFADVSFSYPGRDELALADINLTIEPGETVAFVGMSGGGKSTLASLVPAFYAPTRGEVRLDGEPLQDIALSSLRAQIAMVSQNVVLFDDTVAANIAYGDSRPDRARIQAAAAAAHLDQVIAALPDGFDTVIGDNGSKLSGGQRQRLAIARAIYKDAPILILDEATSALDTESERAVQAALDTLMRGRTTLVIAHRLSTIEHADRIVVLVGGRVVESGTHMQLLERNGAYANLYHLQFEKENQH